MLMKELLWSPLEVRGTILSNRVAVAPMASGSADDDGAPTEKGLELYGKFAASQAGMVVLEHHAVRRDGYVRRGQYSLHGEASLKKHAPLGELFRNAGVPALVQINHAGSAVKDPELLQGGFIPLAPSAVPHPKGDGVSIPREMTKDDCEEMRHAFVQAALRGIRVGYAGVEVHACHGFLLGQFLSPLTNTRRDAYGGDVSGRSRLLRDIVAALREELGEALLSVRLGVADELGEKPRGLAFEDVLWMGKELASLGVDIISVSGNFCGFDAPRSAPWAPYAAAIQQRVGNTPVLCTGNIRSLEEAESLLERGCCTLIGIGRPFVQDPNLLAAWGYAPCKGCAFCREERDSE